jgi:hypothetical protein
MNGVKYCLEALGPWGAATAAHLDLLSAVPDSTGDMEQQPAEPQVAEEGQDDDEADAVAGGDAGGWLLAAVCGGRRASAQLLLLPSFLRGSVYSGFWQPDALPHLCCTHAVLCCAVLGLFCR